jgi:hypothetical protein
MRPISRLKQPLHNQLRLCSSSHWVLPRPRGQVTYEDERGPPHTEQPLIPKGCLSGQLLGGRGLGEGPRPPAPSTPEAGPARPALRPRASLRPRFPPAPSFARVSGPASLTSHTAVHGGGLLCRYHVVVRHVEAWAGPSGAERDDREMDTSKETGSPHPHAANSTAAASAPETRCRPERPGRGASRDGLTWPLGGLTEP